MAGQRAQQVFAARRRGLRLGRLGLPAYMLHLAGRHAAGLGVAALTFGLAAAVWVGFLDIHPPAPGNATVALPWPCDLVDTDQVAGMLGVPVAVSASPPTPTCVYAWQEPGGKVGLLDFAITGQDPSANMPDRCEPVPDLPVRAAHCVGPYLGGSLQFSLGRYQWSCWEESDRSLAAAYRDEKALVFVLATSYAPS
jgi:hypothetical protein